LIFSEKIKKFSSFEKKFWVACRRMGVKDSIKRDIFYEKE
jgi:hypothetical protein